MGENQTNRRRNYSQKKADARREERRAAREAVFALLYETEYHGGELPEVIFARAAEARDIDTTDRYIREEYMGIMENMESVDDLIGRHAKGWRTNRLSRVSRAVLRLGTYELVYAEKIPAPIAINEAVELAKKYDDPKARAFINGVLNAIKNELDTNGGVIPVAETATEPVAVDAETQNVEPEVGAEITVDEPAETATAFDAE